MAVYQTRFTSQVETYLRICEFRAKLEKCPDSPKTRKYMAKLDTIIHAEEPRPVEAADAASEVFGPVKINGTYLLERHGTKLVISSSHMDDDEIEHLLRMYGGGDRDQEFETRDEYLGRLCDEYNAGLP